MAKPPAVRQARPIDAFKAQLKAALPTVMRMLPAHVKAEEFEARVITAVANKPELLECTSESLLKACAEAAELGLSLNPQLGEAWILKVWNGKIQKPEAQLRPGFIGLMKLARQSGEIAQIIANIRYEHDYWKASIVPQSLRHEAADGDRGKKLGAYCWWKLKDGTEQYEYMDADSIEKVKQRSSSKDKQGNIVGPWVTDEDEMWRKTPTRRARKYMPQSPNMAAFHAAATHETKYDFDTDDAVAADIIDVTESADPVNAASAGATQSDRLADKIAPAAGGGGTAVGAQRLPIHQGFDGPDYFGWQKEADVVLKSMSKQERAAWMKAHTDILKDAPQEIIEWAERG